MLLLLGSGPAGLEAEAGGLQPFPSEVRGTYRVAFNGFDIGSFEFRSETDGHSYALTGDTRISALLGAIRWTGATRSHGAIAGTSPRPAAFTFAFDGTSKSGSVQMTFNGGTVSHVSATPVREASPDIVPVRPQHLKDVLDPLTAVMALARPKGDNPCDRKLSIFDGQQRFDLVLSYRRQESIGEARPSGQPGIAFVCGVTYVPIAGHKAGPETQALAGSTGIEIAMRPIPSANIFVPHQIRVPTAAGPATITAQSMHIITPAQQQIALGN